MSSTSMDRRDPTLYRLLWTGFCSFLSPRRTSSTFLIILVNGCFTLKRLVFSTTACVFNDILLLAFIRNSLGVDGMLRNEFGVKTCECSGVCCEGVMMAFLFISATSSLPTETTSGLLVLGTTLLDVPSTGEALWVFFCDRGAAAGVSNTVTLLETWASSFGVTRLGANALSGITEGLKG